jgi:predicted nicotinamide N-methyase
VPELQLYLADEVMPIWRMTEQELGEAGVPPPFWAFAWPGGQAIARYLLDHREEVAGRRVLDIGTGSGLCAIAAMKAGAASALAADIDVFSEEAVALNGRANQVSVAFTNRDLLDARPPAAPKPAEPAGYPAWVSDLILAGDLCYEQPLAGRILAWLQAAHAGGTRVLMGDPGRDYFPREGMVRLVTYQVPTTRELEDREIKQTGVFTLAIPR